MKLPRMRFTVRRMMVVVAIVAILFGAERMWRKRQAYLERAAPLAQMEEFHTELARDLAADPATAGSDTVTALLPDGSAVRFASHGPGRRIHYPPDAATPAYEATAARLEALCRRQV